MRRPSSVKRPGRRPYSHTADGGSGTLRTMSSRALLTRLYRAALRGADPEAAVRRALQRSDVARALASAALRRSLRGRQGRRIHGARREVRHRRAARPRRASGRALAARPARLRGRVGRASRAGPVERARGATRARVLPRVRPGDVVLCLVSGGTSSLLALPTPGLSLAAKRRAVRKLARSGASILELNRLRTSLSAVKGGRLGESDARAPRHARALGRPGRPAGRRRIGADRARPARRRRPRRRARTARASMRRRRPRALSASPSGAIRAAALGRGAARRDAVSPAPRAGCRQATVLLAGGETVVTLPPRHGRGGRSLELALAAAPSLWPARTSRCSPRDPTASTAAPAPPAPSRTARPLARARRRGLDRGRRARAATTRAPSSRRVGRPLRHRPDRGQRRRLGLRRPEPAPAAARIIGRFDHARHTEEPGARRPRAIHRGAQPLRRLPRRARLPELLRSRDVEPRLPVGLSALQPGSGPRRASASSSRRASRRSTFETGTPLAEFGLLAWSLSWEMDIVNILRTLSRGRNPRAGARRATSATRSFSSAATSRG